MKIDPSVIELVASRICHDIISPVGAVHNGVEFMQEAGIATDSSEAIDLISMSAETASVRLQVFRLAYGAGGRDPNIKPEDIQKSFGELIRLEGKVTQAWDPFGPLGPDPLPSGFCKILMGALIMAMECLPRGGSVRVLKAEDNVTHIIAEAGSNGDAAVRENVVNALNLEVATEDLDPRLVHPYVLSVLAQSYNMKVSITEQSPEKVVIALQCNI